MKINVAIAAAARKNFASMPDLPRPDTGRAFAGKYVVIPYDLCVASEQGVIDPPEVKIVSISRLIKYYAWEKYTLKQMKKHFARWPGFRFLEGKKFFAYMERYLEDGPVPVMVIKNLNGTLAVVDGNHRLAAAHFSGAKKIKAYIWDVKNIEGVLFTRDKRSKPFPLIRNMRDEK